MPRVGRRVLATLGAALVLGPGVAAAQEGSALFRDRGLGGSEVFLAPGFSMELGSLGVRAESVTSMGEASFERLSGTATVPFLAGTRLGLSLRHARQKLDADGAVEDHFSVFVQGSGAGVEFGVVEEQTSFHEIRRTAPGWEARGWLRLGPTLGLTIRGSDVVSQGELLERRIVTLLDRYDFRSERRVAFLESARYTVVEVDLGGWVGPVHLTGVLGQGFSQGSFPSWRWAYGTSAIPLSSRVDLVVAMGRNGGLPPVGRPPSGFARMGLRLALGEIEEKEEEVEESVPAMVRGEVRPGESGARLVLVVPGAASVEIRGDFTRWETLALERHGEERWFVELEPGVYRFNIRVGRGSWTVPAGLPSVPDEFTGGPVAIVVVP